MAEILKGAAVAAALTERTRARAEALAERGVRPTLAIVRVGEREEDLSYERGALRRCEKAGVEARLFSLPGGVSQAELLSAMKKINDDETIHGCLLLRPLPAHLREEEVCAALSPEKDVDGITPASLASVYAGTGAGYPPCTAQACLEILDHYGYEISGKRAVVVGRSLVIGRPAAMLLMGRNATVTLCHTRTADLPGECRRSDILVAAAGRAGVVDKTCLSSGQVVLDVGINVTEEGNLTGDVDFAAAEETVAAVTPVPGGVGAVTTAVLCAHVVSAAERAAR